MSLPDEYLQYPIRKYGMDHGHYPWSVTYRRGRVAWPSGRLALLVMPALQWFPMNLEAKPVSPPGMFNRPYPDYRNYSHRDYGLRVGAFRLMRLLDSFGITATVAVNSAVAERYPVLIEEATRRGWEVMGHGVHMGHMHYGGMDPALEKRLIADSLAVLRKATGQKVSGWLSIGKSESQNTPDLLAANGVTYFCDWSNDEMPYRFETAAGSLWAVPHSNEIDDRHLLFELKQREADYVQQLKDYFDTLYREAKDDDGRIMTLPLHPWVVGHPYRTRYLKGALEYIMGHKGVWATTVGEMLAAYHSANSRA